MRTRLLAGFAAVVWIAACGGDDTSDDGTDGVLEIPAECNPLGGQGCMLPWPSMVYAKENPATETGFQLDIPIAAMPVNINDSQVDPARLNRWDGFSAIGPILAMFPTGVSSTGLPRHQDPSESLAPASPIVLLDITSGERVPFFAEVDVNTLEVPQRALIIRPLARLEGGHRYAVAIRNTVKAADGTDLPVPAAFAAMRDGGSYNHPKFAALAARSTAIFDALATAGVTKDELVLAWDFVVVSDLSIRSDLTAMRAAALPAIGPTGANLSFTAVESGNTPQSYKRYLGTFQSPDFLTNGEENDSILRRGADGLPVVQGMRDANFAAIIPKCVETQPLPRPTIVFGHGLFGSAEEYLNNGFVQDLAQTYCFNIIAGDFIGLTERQVPAVASAIANLNRANWVTEKLAQSVIDFIALESITRGPMATSPQFAFNGAPVIDPTKTFYVGGSLGGIMGNTIMAYDPNLTRGVLAVPGGNWSLLLERSTAWSALKGTAQGNYADPEHYQLGIALGLGMGLEPYDPMTTAKHVLRDPILGNPPKKILMWYAIGDALVTNISTEMIAREMGIQMLGPTFREPWNLPLATSTVDSGITVYDEHPEPLPPDTNFPPPSDNGTHSGVNQRAAALRQVQKFLLETTAVNECRLGDVAMPCDCATGACD